MTMSDTPTFVFDDDGRAYAYLGGKIVAAASDVDELEAKLADAPFPMDKGWHDDNPEDWDQAGQEAQDGIPCPDCQGTGQAPDLMNTDLNRQPDALAYAPLNSGVENCPTCGGTGQTGPADNLQAPGDQADPLPGAAPDTLPGDDLPPRATHVVTPNGLKGQILGKQKGLWGDQVTIRLENGRIAKFDVTADSAMEYVTEEKVVAESPFRTLQAKLDEMPEGTQKSLVARLKTLKQIKQQAKLALASGKYADVETAESLIGQADLEMQEVTEALEGLQDATPYAPPAPFETGVVEQESMGGNDSTWLDDTMAEMIQENEGQDFDRMMDEAPEEIVAEMEDPALADAGIARGIAASFINSKTAGLDAEAVAEFKAAFLARVEQVRRAELANRKTVAKAKTASTETYDGPAEGLFL